MSIFDRALKTIDHNLNNEINCIPFGLERFQDYLPGIQKGRYYGITANSGVGKCFAKGTKVIMFNGEVKNIEDIENGEEIMGPDSKKRIVSGRTNGISKMYKISQRNGNDFTVNEDHILYLRKTTNANLSYYNGVQTSKRSGYKSFITMTVKEYLALPNSSKKWYKMAQSNEINFNNNEKLLLDPYFYGLWLGDGDSLQAQITNIDSKIINYIYRFAEENSCKVKINEPIRYYISQINKIKRTNIKTGNVEFFNSIPEISGNDSNLTAYISRACKSNKNVGDYLYERVIPKDLFHNKFIEVTNKSKFHINNKYLLGSKEDRLKLLAGLIDSDGHLNKNKVGYEIIQKNESLIKDICFLSRSLGFVCNYKEKLVNNKIYYKCYISGFGLDSVPVLLDRKKAIKRTDLTHDYKYRRFTIEEVEDNNYYGFMVDCDHLFLLEDFTIVHNTQWTDAFFMYNVIDFVKKNPNIKLKIFYNSLEISKETKIVQGISKQMFIQYKKIIPIETILSLSKSRIDTETYQQICGLSEYFYLLEQYIEFHDDKVNPYGIYRTVKDYVTQEGVIYKKKIEIDGVEHEVFSHYVPNHPDHYVLVITDHVGLLNNEVDVKTKQKLDIKGTIEKHSTNMVELRNNFNIIPVDIQQQAAAKESLDSFKQGKLEPSLEGLAETKLTARNWDVAFGVFSPARHEIPKYKGYDIVKLQDSYRYMNVLKNRYGIANVSDSLFFMGAVNMFYELPKYNDPEITKWYEYAGKI